MVIYFHWLFCFYIFWASLEVDLKFWFVVWEILCLFIDLILFKAYSFYSLSLYTGITLSPSWINMHYSYDVKILDFKMLLLRTVFVTINLFILNHTQTHMHIEMNTETGLSCDFEHFSGSCSTSDFQMTRHYPETNFCILHSSTFLQWTNPLFLSVFSHNFPNFFAAFELQH